VIRGLVYLKGECPAAVLDMTLCGGFGTRHAPLLWEPAKDNAVEALASVASGEVTWALLFWVALMAVADEEATARRWLEMVNERAPDAKMKAGLVVALSFAELAGRYLLWESVLEGRRMGESKVYNQIRAQGELLATRDLLLLLLFGLWGQFTEVIDWKRFVA